jgi:SHS2 domain-containing protein
VVNSTAPGTLKAIKGQVIAINGVILPNNAFVSVQAIAAFYNYTTFASKAHADRRAERIISYSLVSAVCRAVVVRLALVERPHTTLSTCKTREEDHQCRCTTRHCTSREDVKPLT